MFVVSILPPPFTIFQLYFRTVLMIWYFYCIFQFLLKKYLRHEYLHLGQRSNTCYGSCLLPRRLLDYNIIIYNWWWCRNKLPKTNLIFSSSEISHINCFTQEQLEWVSDCCLTPTPIFQLYHDENKLIFSVNN